MNTQPDGSEEVRQLLHTHVQVLANGVIEIKAIVRERGQLIMLAVHSKDRSANAVGLCVGERGAHVKKVVNQLPGDMIHVILWSEFIEEFIRNALAPARVERIVLDAATHRATVHAPSECAHLIEDREGMRRRLVSKLVGWDLQVVET